jgi:hypothetical protein
MITAIITLYSSGYFTYWLRYITKYSFEYTGRYDDKKFKFGLFFLCVAQGFFKSFAWPFIIFNMLLSETW